MRMLGRRLVQLVVVILLVTFFSFSLLKLLPGDPVDVLVPFQGGQQGQQLRQQVQDDLGLDKPFVVQYVDWLRDFATGDLGRDYATNQPVMDKVKNALPVSIQLMLYAQLLALAVAIPLGVISAYRAGSRLDRAANATAFAALAVPAFVVGLVLAYFVGARWKWLPAGGYTPGWLDPVFDRSNTGNLYQHVRTMILPTLALAVGQIAIYMRLLRSDMIATLQESFITMARSKGISNRRILWRHALRPSSLTLLTVAGLNVGTLIGGAVVVEVIFSLPGMGFEIFNAISARQYVALQSFVAIIAIFYVILNFLVDFLYTVLDPRIRSGRVAAR